MYRSLSLSREREVFFRFPINNRTGCFDVLCLVILMFLLGCRNTLHIALFTSLMQMFRKFYAFTVLFFTPGSR